jgi:hypothetical protein
MKYLILSLLIALLGFCSFKAYDLRQLQLKQSELKEDYAEITRVNYGLFNLQLWKEKAITIFENRIKDFVISPNVYDDVEYELTAYLNRAYVEYIENGALFDMIFEEVEKEGNVNGVFLKLLKDNLAPQVKTLDLQSRIPALAKELTAELQRNEPKLKGYLETELGRLLVDADLGNIRDRRIPIYQKYEAETLNDTKANIQTLIHQNEVLLSEKIKWLYALLLGGFFLCVLTYKPLGFRLFITLITAISIVFLFLGVSLPMIDIDARLNDFTMNVLGTQVSFDEQNLYYQSKSILDVTWTLLEGRGIDLKVVGIMILLFSIVVPFIKLVLSTLYLYIDQIKGSKWVESIIFYLGKWSMADVFVVAMFMAYIGFQGLVTAQLGDIGRNNNGYAVETINYSQLSPGALFFTTYCILSIVTGTLLARKFKLK